MLEQQPQMSQGLAVAPEHQAAGGFLVEPVNDPRTQLSSDAGEPADLMEQAVHHGA